MFEYVRYAFVYVNEYNTNTLVEKVATVVRNICVSRIHRPDRGLKSENFPNYTHVCVWERELKST